MFNRREKSPCNVFLQTLKAQPRIHAFSHFCKEQMQNMRNTHMNIIIGKIVEIINMRSCLRTVKYIPQGQQ